jgi:hypothetical protein
MSELDLGKRLLPGETEIIHLIRSFDPESKEAVARVELVKKYPGLEPKKWRGVTDHCVFTLDSFCDWAERWADPATGTIYYNDSEITLVMNEREETSVRGLVESIRYPYEYSQEWQTWQELKSSYSHKELLAFFRKNKLDIVNCAELLDSYGKIRTNAYLEHLSEADSKDGRRIGVQFSSKTASQKPEAAELVGVVVVKIPVFINDDLSDWVGNCTLEFDVHIEEPEEPGKSVTFSLVCAEVEKVRRARIRKEIEALNTRLDKWLIVNGTPSFEK